MYIDLQPLHEEGRDCLEDAIITAAMCINKEYELAFSEAWNFALRRKETSASGLLGTRIFSNIGNIRGLLKKYYGVVVNAHSEKDPMKVIEEIKYELAIGRPVLILLDCFNCPWHNSYKKNHSNHACLVTGFVENDLYCIDSQPVNTGSVLTLENFINGFIGYSTFSVISEEREEFNLKKCIEDRLLKLYTNSTDSSAFNDIRRLSQEIADINLTEEFNGYTEIWRVPLLSNLHQVTGGRKHYAKFLYYLCAHYRIDALFHISEQLEYISSAWSKARALLIKSSIMNSKNSINHTVSNIIMETADIEEKVACELEELINNKNEYTFCKLSPVKYTNNRLRANNEISAYTFLDLQNFFNSKGIGSEDVNEYNKADLSSTGYFILNNNLCDDSVWNVGQMKFKFPRINGTDYDNISCCGQTIDIGNEEYEHIMFLGTSEWGSYKEKIKMNFTNGRTGFYELAISDWAVMPVFNEEIAWEGNGAYRNNNSIELTNEKVRIFAKTSYMGRRGLISSITLPDCQGIHLFAITLAK